MTLLIWSRLESLILTGKRDIATCHKIGGCVDSLRQGSDGQVPMSVKEIRRELLRRVGTDKGITTKALRGCLEISEIMTRAEAEHCTRTTLSHFFELYRVTSPDNKRAMLLEAEAGRLTCRQVRVRAERNALESTGMPPQLAMFSVAVQKSNDALWDVVVQGVHRSLMALVSLPGPDREYLSAKARQWRDTLSEVSQDIAATLAEASITPPAGTEPNSDAA